MYLVVFTARSRETNVDLATGEILLRFLPSVGMTIGNFWVRTVDYHGESHHVPLFRVGVAHPGTADDIIDEFPWPCLWANI